MSNLIVDSGIAENLVSLKLVDHLKLSTESREKPYTLGWVSKGSQIQITLAYRVLIFIEKYYREEVFCDVLDMDVYLILLSWHWQVDNDITYRGRNNLIIFTHGT